MRRHWPPQPRRSAVFRLPFGLAVGRWVPGITLAVFAALHLLDRVIAGLVQCHIAGCS
ncbi:MAG TPA: hypothetical protein VFF98_17315 [Novosphingobium sp.]|nr:hypothetical protein [Novosphingobium sp.]